MNGEPYWFSRITPRPDLGYRKIVTLGDLDPYGQHQALWKLFDMASEERTVRTEFLFRTEQQKGLPVFFVLSRRQPQDHVGLWRIESKPYRPDIRPGDSLAFKLRANPTVARPGESGGKSRRHDVVMDTKKRMDWKGLAENERPTLAHLAYEAGGCWLRNREERLGCNFQNNALRVDGYRTWRTRRRKNVELSTLDFEGILAVNDQQRFLDAILLGIGPAKAFGCGLMLVRRI